MPNEDIFVNDLRPDNDPSRDLVPKISTFEELESYFHMNVRYDLGRDRAMQNERYFALVGFELRTGAATYIPKVLDESGNPLAQILVYRWWNGAPDLPAKPDPDYFGDNRGVAGFTDANGVIGFGFAGESVVLEDGGPDAIWCSADPATANNRRVGSDMVEKLGWYGGTNHLVANPIYKVTTKVGTSPPGGDTSSHYITVGIDGNEVWRGNFLVSVTVQTAQAVRVTSFFQEPTETIPWIDDEKK